jgi:hypothetical protein
MERWRRSIARGAEQNRLESIARSAAASPADSLEAAFALSAFAVSLNAKFREHDPVAPAAVWRRRSGTK